jgi:hypothetical protein
VTVRELPALNALLNAASAVALLVGFWLIRHGRWRAHRAAMVTALVFSAAFLTSYLVYHAQVGSVRFQGTGWVRTLYLSILATHTVLAAAVPVLDRAADAPPVPQIYEVVAPPSPGLVFDGVAVENVYPYDRSGRLLHDVRLYDSRGRPLELMSSDPDRRPVRERNGARAFNAYPIRYFEPGTRRVARPNAGPEIEPAPLRTRPPG